MSDHSRVEFWVPGDPQTQGNHRIQLKGKTAKIYDSNAKDLEAWRMSIVLRARETRVKFNGPVSVEVHFYMPRKPSHWKVPGVLAADAPHIHCEKPDVDKLLRAVLDALTKSFMIRDDCWVPHAEPWKWWANGKAGAKITVKEVPYAGCS